MQGELFRSDPGAAEAGGASAAAGAAVDSERLAPGCVWFGAGPRVVEARVLAELCAHAEAIRRDPSLLARPLRVVVPSRSLRSQLAGGLARALGRGSAGILIQTSTALALEVCERAGVAAPASALLMPVHVRREARREPLLRASLERLRGGYQAVQAAVSDLLDAGFGSHHAEFVYEAIEQAGSAQGDARERALAVARIAQRIAAQIESGAAGHGSALFRSARECLEAQGAELLPAHSLYIHGFADATGVHSDWLEALLRVCGARALFDRPPDPGDLRGQRVEAAFAARLGERLARAAAPPAGAAGQAGASEGVAAPADARAPLELILASTPEREARACAFAVARCLASGVEPEGIAIAARDLSRYAIALRRELARLAIPCSALGAQAPGGSEARQLRAFVALLERGPRTPIGLWLDALEALPPLREGDAPRRPSLAERSQLRRALMRRGAAVLGSVPDVSAPREAPEILSAALGAARAGLEALSQLALARSCAAQRAGLEVLAAASLGWSQQGAAAGALASELLGPLARERAESPLAPDELCLLAQERLERAGRAPLGGAGGGVQVLTLVEARARSFEALFVLGLNRGHFPRPINEDPLLPDGLRRELRALLPDLPVKSEGHAEERYLFAQLVSASPRVVLFSARREDGAGALPLSPLVLALPPERLRLREAESLEVDAELPPGDALLAAARAGRGAHFESALVAALLDRDAERAARAEPGGAEPGAAAAGLARARCAVLGELDAGLRAGLGPYLGFSGARAANAAGAIAITQLESVAKCGWRSFLRQRLRLRPGPEDELPGLTPLRIGNVVHAALEAIALRVCADQGVDLAACAANAPRALAWPSAAELEALTLRSAERVCREEGIGFPGFARALATRAALFLEQAREVDWAAAAPQLLGSEIRAELRLASAAGAERRISFRADRVDALPGGGLRLTDYKTGAPEATGTTPKGRQRQLLEKVHSGALLQAAGYARLGQELGRGGVGRYLFLSPDLAAGTSRELAIDGADLDFAESFDAAALALLEAVERGVSAPRLVEAHQDQEPSRCGSCELKTACLRGDSGARGRLREWTQARRAALEADPAAASARLSPLERTLLSVWDPKLRSLLQEHAP